MHATDGTSGTGTADSGNLHAALHAIRYGIVLLDAGYHAVFINNAFRRMWRLPDDLAESAPPVGVLFEHGWSQGFYRVQEGEHDSYIATRMAQIERLEGSGQVRLDLQDGRNLLFESVALDRKSTRLNSVTNAPLV